MSSRKRNLRSRAGLVPVAILALSSLLPLWQRGQAFAKWDVADSVIGQEILITDPPAPCEVAAIAGFITAAARVPAGIEHVPGTCDYSNQRATITRQSLMGWTVRRALDLLVDHDQRYTWSVVDDGISFRPVVAVGLSSHVLHTTIGKFEVTNANLDGAFAEVMQMFGVRFLPRPVTRTAQEALQFSVPSQERSALQALDAVVRHHGAMRWEARYCKAELSRRMAFVSLYTFDKGGLTFQLDQSFRSRDEVDPCSKGNGATVRDGKRLEVALGILR